MKILQVGLGSMGQRRIRCMKKLGYQNIIGFDPRPDRQNLVTEKYDILTLGSWAEAKACDAKIWIISTPPDTHVDLGLQAIDQNAHFFAEAGVDDPKTDLLKKRLEETKLIGAASCTMNYFKGPSVIREIVTAGTIGTPKLITYQSGQYLPDWHPWEDYRDFYVSKPHTGACREIVPFELNWLTSIFGDVSKVACMKDKITDLDTEIDDIYQLLLSFQSGLSCHLMVDVIAQPAIRIFRLCGTKGSLEWDHGKNEIRLFSSAKKAWETISLAPGEIAKGYVHQEEPYVSEMSDFFDAVNNIKDWSNSFEQDERIIKILLAAEKASKTGMTQIIPTAA